MNDMSELPGLPPDVAAAMADGRLADPFAVLGPHDSAAGPIVRAFVPGALQVEVLSREDGRSLGHLPPAPPHGLFAGRVTSSQPYLFRITWPGAVQEIEDSYSFGPLLGDLD